MEDMKAWALFYAEKGWPVLPCNKEKKPLIKHGSLDASTDPELIKRWWAMWPDANIGVATGNGLAVVDIDLMEVPIDLDLPVTLVSKTGRGWHFWYSTPQPVRGGANINQPHIDR